MFRQSKGGRLLAIVLAGVMTFNCNSVTAFAKNSLATAVEVQAEEETSQEVAALSEEAGEDASSAEDNEAVDETAQESSQDETSETETEEDADAVSEEEASEDETSEEEISEDETSEEEISEDETSEEEISEDETSEEENSEEEISEDETSEEEASQEASTESAAEEMSGEEGAEGASTTDASEEDGDSDTAATEENSEAASTEENAAASVTEEAAAEATTAEAAKAEEAVGITGIKAVAVDQNGEVIKGYESVSLPSFDKELRLADPSAAPVAIKGYDYVGAKVGDKSVNAIAVKKAGDDGRKTLCFLTDGGEIEAGEQSVLTLCYKWIDVKRVYTYEDSKVKVTATLQRADAVPDDAVFKVTEITPKTKGYSYDTYMELVNKEATKDGPGSLEDALKYAQKGYSVSTDKPYAEYNTLVYDVAFMVDKRDDQGNVIKGEQVEFQPESGSVKIDVEFKKDQLEKIGIDDDHTLEVVHLPLTDEVKKENETTKDAENLSVDDLGYEEVKDLNSTADEASFSLNSFSPILFKAAPVNGKYPGSTTDAVNYDRVLGRAAEYGIVADTYNQLNHAQTNFAVKHYRRGQENDDPDLGGTHVVPFIVGEIVTDMRFGGSTASGVKMQYDIYTDVRYQEVIDREIEEDVQGDRRTYIKLDNKDKVTTHMIYQDNATISSNIDKMLQDISDWSQALATTADDEGTIKLPASTNYNKYVLDTTSYPDNAVVYVDVPNGFVNKIMANEGDVKDNGEVGGGFVINKKPGQNIVLNIHNDGSVLLKSYFVCENGTVEFWGDENNANYKINGAQRVVKTTTDIHESQQNMDVDTCINRHVILNFVGSGDVDLKATAGCVIAPNANVLVSGSSAGWIASGKTVTSNGAEFHFNYHDRKYTETTKDSIYFSFTKEVWDKNNTNMGLLGKTFNFERYVTGEDFNTEGLTPVENQSTSETSKVTFGEIAITNDDIGTHYYVIKEIDGGSTIDGIKYWGGELRIKLTVESSDSGSGYKKTVEAWKTEHRTAEGVSTRYYEPFVVNSPEVTFGEIINKKSASVSISKVDATSEEEVAGAHIQVLKVNEEGEETIVDEWDSSAEEAHVVGGLDAGVTYTLRETVAPDGYTIATDTTFTVDENGKVTTTGTVSSDGTILVEDTKTKVKISKTDITGETELAGATIRILDKDGNVVKIGEQTLEWLSTTQPKEIEGLTAGVEYTLHEETAPNGYKVASDIKFTIGTDGKVTAGGKEVEGGRILINDELTKVKISKTDITGETELAGATIQILDDQGEVIKVDGSKLEWISGTSPKEIEGLTAGLTYTLHEETAPNGYKVASDISFKIEKDGTIKVGGKIVEDGRILINDELTKVKISKTDITGETELAGATIQILDDQGEVIKVDGSKLEWISGTSPKEIEGLTAGLTYTLHEETAPNGYKVASDISFKIEKDGTIKVAGKTVEDGLILINDALTEVSISKTDITGETELAGATIQILDKDGDVVKVGDETLEWTSTTEPRKIEGLTAGVEYTLHEEAAPNGYKVASDITFTIEKDGTVKAGGKVVEGGRILINDELTEVKISKIDIADGAELPGAKIQILDKDGNVVEIDGSKLEWTSTDKPHVIEGLTAGVEYTLHEEVAPGGYTIATDTTFVLKADGTIDTERTTTKTENGILLVEDAKKAVGFSKRAVSGEAELPGAKLQILDENGEVVRIDGKAQEWTSSDKPYRIEGLPAGNYTMREITAPAGYVVTTDITFTVDNKGDVTECSGKKATDSFGNSVVIMEDALTKVSISKKAVGGEEELPGATIQIRDDKGNVVEIDGSKLEWTSSDKPYEIEGLTAGVTYTLHEETAPNGYKVASDITFKIDTDGTVKAGDKVVEGGLLLINDALTEVSISKKAVGGEEELPGATIQILDKDGNVVKVGDETLEWTSTTEPRKIEGLTAGVEYTLHEEAAPNGYKVASDITFTIEKDGTVKAGGKEVEGGLLLIEDELTKVSISKKDIAGEEELPGATIQILDDKGKVVEINGSKLEWTSTDKPHEIEGLTAGVEYTLHEEVAPNGYTVATDTTFTIDKTGKVTTSGSTTQDGALLINDAKTLISVSKTDITGEEELPGATIQILDKDGKVVEIDKKKLEWTSTDQPHMIEGLTTGVEYTLHETVAPDGYKIAADTKFVLNADGSVNAEQTTAATTATGKLLIKDEQTEVQISKTDITGEKELKGAHIEIYRGNEFVDGWDSEDGGKPHMIKGLTTGVEYTLRETVAPDGYTITTDTKFTLKADGTIDADKTTAAVKDGVLLVKDDKTKVSISKRDITGEEELAGATIQILDDKGNVVELDNDKLEWTSGTEAKTIEGLTAGVEYTLHEEAAPNGYTVASDIKFTIGTDGKVTAGGKEVKDGRILIEDALTSVKISKTDIGGGKELPGATIQILDKDGNVVEIGGSKLEWTSTEQPKEIKGLTAGVEYTLRETVAPDGYTIASDIKFTIGTDGKVTAGGKEVEGGRILIEDALTKVKVSKTDITGDTELPGATIQILDKDGNVVEINNKKLEWVSEDKPHEIEGLTTGVEYTLRETVAPNGYKVATDTTFTLNADGTIDTKNTTAEVKDGVLLVKDSKTSVKISKTDIDGEEELPGATIQILDKDGNVVKIGDQTLEWTSEDKPHEIEGLTAGVTYTLHEETAPNGYKVASDIEFTIDKDGKVTAGGKVVQGGLILIKDELTSVKISKTDIAGEKELPGAIIQVLDKDGNVVKIGDQTLRWTSGETPHEIKGLTAGETYTLRESVAPDGYTIASDITFTIDKFGNVKVGDKAVEGGRILIKDELTKVKVSKTDIADGKELEGAKIQILDSNGNVVKLGDETLEWVSTKEPHLIEGLLTGVEYTLHEEVAPNGYTIATDTKFTIDVNGKVTTTGSITEDGVLLIEDAITRIKVSKVDIANGEEIEGAKIEIVYTDKDGKEKVFEKWTSTKEAHTVEGLTTGVEYTLRETVAPDGYTVAAETKFKLDEQGNVTTEATVNSDGVILVEDAMTKIHVSKVDIADGEKLEGAHIQIIDKKGNVVEEWDSTKEAHEIIGLKTGEEYTLRETVAPEGHVLTSDTKFTIDEKGNVTSSGTVTADGVLLVEDAKTSVKVSKVDIADGKELEGAHIQIIEKDEFGKETVVEEWDSTKKPHMIEGLKTGVEYTLRETVAPEGHILTTDTTFTIDQKGKVTTTGTISKDGVILVEDAKTSVKVSKTDIANGKEIEGAKIQIIEKDKNGKETVVEEWISSKKPHEIEGLKTNVEYTLRETVAPDGYTVATDTTFTIDENGKVTTTGTITEKGILLVEDAKTVIKVSKTDIANGEEIAGAKIEILDKNGKVVEKWTSTTEPHTITGLKTGEEYTLRETVAPDGYAITTDTKFSIDKNGKVTSTGSITKDGVLLVEDAKTVVKVSKVDIANGKELEGAHIQIIVKGLFGKETVVEEWDSTKGVHEIIGLKTGVEYILRETVAPDGYAITTDTTFKLDEAGNVTSSGTVSKDGVLLVEDAKTVVKVSKVDIADGKELPGAKIQIIDENGKIVEEWVSTKEAHVIEGLKTGVKYTLRETVAPNGYEIATDTTFTIDKYGKVTTTGSMTKDGTILIQDKKKAKTSSKKSGPSVSKHGSSRTGDDANALLWLILALASAGSLVYVFKKRRKNG